MEAGSILFVYNSILQELRIWVCLVTTIKKNMGVLSYTIKHMLYVSHNNNYNSILQGLRIWVCLVTQLKHNNNNYNSILQELRIWVCLGTQ